MMVATIRNRKNPTQKAAWVRLPVTCQPHSSGRLSTAVRGMIIGEECKASDKTLRDSSVAPAFDIFCYEGNLACFYEVPWPIAPTDRVAVSRTVVTCLWFLRRKGLALRVVDDTIFCEGDEEYVCKLSPTDRKVEDQDGYMLRYMPKLSELAPFTGKRMQHAPLDVQHIADLGRYPVTWDHVKDCAPLLNFVTLASGTQMFFEYI